MADIFLTHAHDPQRYISCYQELAAKLPGPPTELLLGNAFMNVQEVCVGNTAHASCHFELATIITSLSKH